MADAKLICRWYTYRWRVEEYHKILKAGCTSRKLSVIWK